MPRPSSGTMMPSRISVATLVALDALIAVVSYHAAFVVRSLGTLLVFEAAIPIERYFQVTHYFGVLIGAHLFLLYLFGLYDEVVEEGGERLLKATLAQGIAISTILAAFYFLRAEFIYPRSIFVVFGLLNVAVTYGSRLILRSRLYPDGVHRRVAVVGRGEEAANLVAEIEHLQPAGIELVGVVLIGDDATPRLASRLLGRSDALPHILKDHGINEVIFADDPTWKDRTLRELRQGTEDVQVTVLPTYFDLLIGRPEHLRVHDIPVIHIRKGPMGDLEFNIKRIIDVIVALSIGIVSLPLWLVLIPTMKIAMPGPILFWQRRVGFEGRVFALVKLRTMVPDAEKLSGPSLVDEQDPRVPPLGRFLRKTRLDEIPQIWNVLRGEMSIVGPRPERPEFVGTYERDIPGYMERHTVKPGLTGLAQVNGTYVTTAKVKLMYDLSYIYNFSLLLDVRIVIQTLKLLLTGRGEYRPRHPRQ